METIMKLLLGLTTALAVAGTMMLATGSADARGGIGAHQVRIGPRYMPRPRINPWRVPPYRTYRQISGPRESGRGLVCHYVVTSRRPIVHINPRTGASETTYITTGYRRCPRRY
jgi:hypothetical protein